MTFRAFAIGIVCALFIAGFGYVNDWIWDLERFTSGHMIPVMVIGPLFLFVATLNQLLFRVKQRWAFTGRELAVVFVITAAACSVPGRNLMEHFTQVLIMPHQVYKVNPGWKDKELIKYFPEGALVDPEHSPNVLNGYVTGMAEPEDKELPFADRMKERFRRVPWSAWLPPLRIWLPIILLGMVCYGCLALILHKQWSQHEHLAYPIAEFVSSLLSRKDSESTPPALRERMFWIGLAVVLAIRLNNGLCVWFPEHMIPVQLRFSFHPFLKIFPVARKVLWGTGLFRFELFPVMVAFAFLLSTEISFTMGVSQIAWMLFAAPLVTVGMDFTTDYSGMGWSGWQRGGSYIAYALMLAYTGRYYYGSLLRSAATKWNLREDADRYAVWATRFLFVAGVSIVVLVSRLGVAWPFAAGTVGLGLLSCVVVSRISVETGLFFIHPRWQPFSFLLAMLGGYLVNPSTLVAMVMVCFMFSIDQSQAYLPYLANGLKVCERLRVPKVRLASTTLVVCALGIVLAVVIGLVATYDAGTPKQCRWSYDVLPKLPFKAVEPEILQLKGEGRLEAAETVPWYSKLDSVRPKRNALWAAGFGFAAVLVFSILRLRLPRWPLHPVLFLVWVTWPMYVFSYSILLGWLVKKLSIRFGGYAVVRKLKPLMFGVISAEILGALIFMVVGAVYFLITGNPPKAYRYFPR